jgi:hypothetical protein
VVTPGTGAVEREALALVSSPAFPPPPDDETQPVARPPPTGIVPSDPATPVQPEEPCVFDVREYGAVGDGSTDDTRAFREAWRAACDADSAVLLVPSDGTFTITATTFSGPCKSGLVFQVTMPSSHYYYGSKFPHFFAEIDETIHIHIVQLDGVLMPPDGPDCWPPTDNRRKWLVFSNLDGLTLGGAGTIEGNGENWWNLPCKPHRVRLHIGIWQPTIVSTPFRCN